MNAEEDARALLFSRREEIRNVVAASCGQTVGDMAADAITAHVDCIPWDWRGRAVICGACDAMILPEPDDVIEQGALAWSQ